MSVSFKYIFLITFFGWCWLIKLDRFQVYSSILRHMYIVCALNTQSWISFCHNIFDPLSVLITFRIFCLFVCLWAPSHPSWILHKWGCQWIWKTHWIDSKQQEKVGIIGKNEIMFIIIYSFMCPCSLCSIMLIDL